MLESIKIDKVKNKTSLQVEKHVVARAIYCDIHFTVFYCRRETLPWSLEYFSFFCNEKSEWNFYRESVINLGVIAGWRVRIEQRGGVFMNKIVGGNYFLFN